MTGAPIQRANTGHRIGESHPRSKLTDEKVREIRAHRKEGKGYKRIAKLTGIPVQTVRDVLSYRTWRHVIDAPDGSRGTVAP
jgi:hypothetical protein